MKKVLFLFLFSGLIICSWKCENKKADNKKEGITAASFLGPLDRYRIRKSLADSMISYYDTCTVGCDNANTIKDLNPSIFRLIRSRPFSTVSYVIARYWPENQRQYCERQPGGGPGPVTPNCMVAGHWTLIVRATPPTDDAFKTTAFTDEDVYFDIVTICPPPEDASGNCALPFIPGPDSTKIDSAKKVKTTETK